VDGTQPPPRTIGTTIAHLGPGIIIAGSIVGSGELIATTKVGAEAGFWLLWLILIGCTIKVFAQVEFGRYTLIHQQTPLAALDSLPGPRLHVNAIIWYWVFVILLVVTQQGGIVGGVGQALSISFPLTREGKESNRLESQLVKAHIELKQTQRSDSADHAELQALQNKKESLQAKLQQNRADHGEPKDVYLWSALLAIVTSILLYIGHYHFIQMVCIVFVGSFTLMTVATVCLLQSIPDWQITNSEILQGLSFRLPPSDQLLLADKATTPLKTALFAFGIIGVGAVELIAYPYWCLEKGYARFSGQADGSDAWAERAQGWMRVMRIDAWSSMVVYTVATVAFYLLGAAVLHRAGLIPEKGDMIRTLSEMYVPVFGVWAQHIFLFGAFAVLYSTFFVAAAGMARMIADALILFGLVAPDKRLRWTQIISVVWPLMAAAIYWIVGWAYQGQSPAAMVMASGAGQAIMLPMLGYATLYFRYKRCHPKLEPGKLWDVFLWLSVIGFAIAGVWTLYLVIRDYLS